jgi:DNA modification methylase
VTVRILIGDVRERLKDLADESVHCVVTSPPYWGLRDYGMDGQMGVEPTLGEHIETMVSVFDDVRRVLRKEGTLWLNYGDCYATKPNGKSAASYKADGSDDRTFRDKPFSTVGPVYSQSHENGDRRGRSKNKGSRGQETHSGRVVAGGFLKPKDLCMIPNRLAIALQDDGWWVRAEIVWGKPNAMPDSSGKYRPGSAHEKIFMLAKSGKCYYDSASVALACSDNTHARVSQKRPDNWDTGPGAHGSFHRKGREKGGAPKQDGHGRRRVGFNDRYFGAPGVTPKSAPEDSNIRAKGSWHASTTSIVETRYLRNYEPAPAQVWEIPARAFTEAHFATFPPELAERCILAGCPPGGTVLDPFGGAGTTGLVADRLQRNAILIELNPQYAAMAEKRIHGDAPLFSPMEAAE